MMSKRVKVMELVVRNTYLDRSSRQLSKLVDLMSCTLLDRYKKLQELCHTQVQQKLRNQSLSRFYSTS